MNNKDIDYFTKQLKNSRDKAELLGHIELFKYYVLLEKDLNIIGSST